MKNRSSSSAAAIAAALLLAACGSDETAEYPNFADQAEQSAQQQSAKVQQNFEKAAAKLEAEAKAAAASAETAAAEARANAKLAAAEAKADMNEAAASASANVKQAGAAAREKTDGLIASAKETVRQAGDAAAAAVDKVVDGAKDLSESTDEAMNTAAAKIAEVTDSAVDKTKQLANSAAADAKTMADSATKSAKQASEKAANAAAATAASAKAALTPDGKLKLDNDTDKFSYAIGAEIAKSLDGMGDELNPDMVLAAMKRILDGGESQLSEAEVQSIRQQAMVRMQEKRAEESKLAAKRNTESSKQFLASVNAKEGVQRTDSGLLYRIEKAGEGDTPAATDRVEVHYRGTLPDGTEFDSSYSRGAPATFALNQVIPGWTEGLQLMKPGGKARFWIPAALAYGERGAGGKIGPNQALVFDVELIAIKDKQQ